MTQRTTLLLTPLALLVCAAPAAAFQPVESAQISSPGAANPVVSHDGRYARYIAYEQGGAVRVVKRKAPFDSQANQTWRPGSTATLAGASSPDLDGGPNDTPSCVVYVKGGGAWVAGLDGRGARRVAGGGVSGVAVNGDCEKVAYVTPRGLFVFDRVTRKATRVAGGATDPIFGKSNKGQTSYFTYTRGGDIYRGSHTRTRGRGQVSSRLVGPGSSPSPQGRNRFVAFERGDSVYRAGQSGGSDTVSGGGASDPDISDAGEFVAFTSMSANLGVPGGGSGIFIWTQARRANERLSPPGIAASNVQISARGNYAFYEGAKPGEQPSIWMTYLGGEGRNS